MKEIFTKIIKFQKIFIKKKKGNDGIVEFWDYRTRDKVKGLILRQGEEISCIKSD